MSNYDKLYGAYYAVHAGAYYAVQKTEMLSHIHKHRKYVWKCKYKSANVFFAAEPLSTGGCLFDCLIKWPAFMLLHTAQT